MTDHIRWGILGAAGFARKTMAPAITEARRSALVALATRDAAKAAPFAAIAPGLAVHDSYDALLADPAIDAVYIPLPNALHVDWSIRAAEAGKAVLCEKPIALQASDFDRLIETRDRTGRLIAEAWMPAHHPQWAKVRDLIADGALGRLHTVTGVFTYGLADPSNIRLSPDLAGGALRDVGVYPIGAFRFATGLEPEIQWADAIREGGVDTSAWVQARAGEVRFSFHVSMRTTRYQAMVFAGDAGRLTVTAPFNAGQYGQADLVLVRDGQPTLTYSFPEARQYALQVEAVAATLLDGAPFPYPLEAARGTQAAIDAVFDRLEA
ncbi:Gfo/Idh/MocA family protein [Roseicyclus persicicus]|uniref:Gfo/Idh/MocA family oxidoreductase n=1 Tax=Roseicyclus persicicus TaxID=2650661 RepID=A0A7X6GW38_9RHOB|nr:Gfo/Idh/MocA family oxidoreductase [Roseibacterium persicicum]NKX43441.1 Gfo/Idh/MocA family oxidoreductase [Roseibacterium persicicum]